MCCVGYAERTALKCPTFQLTTIAAALERWRRSTLHGGVFLDKLSQSRESNGTSCNTAVEKCDVCSNLRDWQMADPGPFLMGRALDGGHIFRNAIDGEVSLPYI